MKLSNKLVGLLLGVGVIPAAIVGTISLVNATKDMKDENKVTFATLTGVRDIKKGQLENYFAERKADMGVLVETVNTLRDEAFDKLTANREIKKAATKRYFQTINDQILSFSENQMVVDAMRELRVVFPKFREENEVTSTELERMKKELLTYYTADFSDQYAELNGGKDAEAKKYFAMLDDDSVAFQYHYIQANENPLGDKHKLDRPDDQSQYSELHEKIHPIVRSYLERFGYYDIFLADPDTGDILYSVFKELDYSTSLEKGPYSDTNFGEAFRRANAADNRDTVILVDYAQYTPSYEAPASFIASPIFDGDTKIGVALFQMPIDVLNEIMSERAGLGETGETYLVGSDLLMRSDSFLDPENHTVDASFRNPELGKVETKAAREALAGKTHSEIVIDYNGNPVLSSYAPIEINGMKWAILAEIDVAEAYCPKIDGAEKDYFTHYKEQYGYYDLFLINPDGYCFYTVTHEDDYQSNLVDGQFSDSNLGVLVRKVLKTGKFGIADFRPYAPSNDAPAAFMAQPVVNNGETEVIVALQLPLETINGIMGVRSGMGTSGESYLVGPDNLMRSDSYLDPKNHSVVASFKDPSKGTVESDASMAALGGESGNQIVIDYNGNPVLSSYAPIKVGDSTWALLAEVDEAEAYAGFNGLILTLSVLSGVILASVLGVAVYCGRSVSRPIDRVVRELSEGADTINGASEQISEAGKSLAEATSDQAASLEETSASLEEMASMTSQNTENARSANKLAGEARAAADAGTQDMEEMAEAMKAIKASNDNVANIIKTIDEIAFQTNILALNAAVEAARAGDAGMGFAVVAEEVRNLAQRSANAAKETTEKIEDSISKSENGVHICSKVVEGLAGIADKTRQVDGLVSDITQASEQQTEGIGQINSAMTQIDQSTQDTAANAEESASAAAQLSSQARAVEGSVNLLRNLVGGEGNASIANVAKNGKATLLKPPTIENGSVIIGAGVSGRNSNGSTIPMPSRQEAASVASDDFKDF